MTDELGHVTTWAYDEFRRITAVTDALGRTTTYSYDLPGGCACSHAENKQTRITLPSGKVTVITYDLDWRKISETVGYGTAGAATTQYQYDTAGNLIATVDPRNHTWSNTYDNRNRRITSRDPLGNTSTFSYDAVGNVATVTRPDGGVTTNAYDVMNRLVWTRDPKMQVTQMSYDNAGNMTSLTDARNNTYGFTYDLDNRRTRMTYPGTGGDHEDYDYDEVGNLLGYRNRAGNIRTYSYDNRNRETVSSWDDGVTPAIARYYNAAGLLTNMTSSVSSLSYTYDAANQLLSETAVVGSQSSVVSYTYDLDGNRQTLTYPSGTVITYGYTGRNQLGAVASDQLSVVSYQYDLAGNRTGKTLENGTSVAYAQDNASRLLSVRHSNAAGP